MSDTTPIPPASERELLEEVLKLLRRSPKATNNMYVGNDDVPWGKQASALSRRIAAALSHPSTQGWKQIGWTCGEGDCGRIHESPGAEGSYAVPVYVPSPPEQGGKG